MITTVKAGLRAQFVFMSASAAVLQVGVTPATAQDCNRFGKPSFEAVRTVQIGERTLTGRAFVTPDREREELVDGAKTMVRITDPTGVTLFDPAAKSGVFIPKPPAPAQAPAKGDTNTRLAEAVEGDRHIVTISSKGPNGWIDVVRVVCRADGVMMERDIPTVVNKVTHTAKMRHSDVVIKPLDPTLFKAPDDIKLSQPAPPTKTK
jgi:hypothetical protein